MPKASIDTKDGFPAFTCVLDTEAYNITLPTSTRGIHISFNCNQDLTSQKNSYKITVNTKIADKNYRKLTDVAFRYRTEAQPLRIKLGMLGSSWIVEDGAVEYTEPNIYTVGGEQWAGLTFSATDKLSYYLERLRPEISTSGTIKQVIRNIFNEYPLILNEYKSFVMDDDSIPETKKVKINMDGTQTIEDALNDLAYREKVQWCVIDKELYVSKYIRRQRNIGAETEIFFHNLESHEFTDIAVMDSVYFNDRKQRKLARIVTGNFVAGRAGPGFRFPFMRPGEIIKVNVAPLVEAVGFRGNLLVTTLIHRNIIGAYEAEFEGIRIETATGYNHPHRYISTSGLMTPLKRRHKLYEYSRNVSYSRPAILVGEIFNKTENNSYTVKVGQSLSFSDPSRALRAFIPKDSPEISNVPLASPLGPVGTNSSELANGTKVLLACNRNDMSDLVITAIIDDSVSLPYVKIKSNGEIIINYSGTGTVKLGSKATKGVAREGDSVRVVITGGSSAGTYDGWITGSSSKVLAE